MVATHCGDSHSLGTGQLPTNPIPGQAIASIPSGGVGHGNIRGVVVYGHGWNEGPNQVGGGEVGVQTLVTNLVNDGWIVFNASYPEDNYVAVPVGFTSATPSTGTYLDFTNDTGHGARYLATWLHTWDHIVGYCQKTYGAGIPIVPFGVSWGGWHMAQIALNKFSTIAAWGIHIPVTVISVLETGITIPYNWSTVNTTGADITTLQGIGNGSQDVLPLSVVGWSNPDTVAESYLIKPYADTAVAGYYSGLMTENAETEGHIFSSGDATYYTDFFTGGGSPFSSTFCVDHLCPKAF
jgi:hypothetical protein